MKTKLTLIIILGMAFCQTLSAQSNRLDSCCFEIDSVGIQGDTSLCCNDSLLLCVPEDTCLNYQWYLDGNPIQLGDSPCIYIYEGGYYHVVMWNACDTFVTEDFWVHDFSTIPYIYILNYPLEFCEGDSLNICVDSLPCVNYQWYFGDSAISGATDPCFTVYDSGYYHVVVYNECDTVSSSAVFVSENWVDVNIVDIIRIRCSSCGFSATAEIDGNNGPWQVSWSNGEIGEEADSLCVGQICVTVTDAFGCTATDCETIVSVTRLDAAITCSAPSGKGCLLTVNASGGTPPYTYLWSNGSTSSSIGANNGVSYTVTVTDAAGCTKTASGGCYLCSKEKSLNEETTYLESYPNPATDFLTVYGTFLLEPDVQISVYDALGKEVINFICSSPQLEINIDMRDLSEGLYILKAKTPFDTRSIQILKK